MVIMQKDPIRVLAIAPYEGMLTALLRAAESFSTLWVDAYTGDLEEGAAIVRRMNLAGYDVVLSRGGTADLIREATELPVVEIPASVYDLLRTIKLSENYAERCAIVGFSAITENAYTLCNLLQLHIPVHTVRSAGEIPGTLQKLHSENIRAVICDMVTHRIARENGFNAFLVASGEQSIVKALQEAEAQGGSFRRMNRENLFLRSVLGRESEQCFALNSDGQCVFTLSNPPSASLLERMRQAIPSVSDEAELLFYHRERSALHAIYASAFQAGGKRYTLFRDKMGQLPLRAGQSGIRTYDRAECEELFMNSFFSISGSMGELEGRLAPIAAARQCVVVHGEEGSGKEQIVRALYLRSRLQHHPLVVINCARLEERRWEFLLTHHASPLSSLDTAVCFQHLEDAPAGRREELISLIEDMRGDKRIWFLFSCDETADAPPSEVYTALAGRLGALTLRLPPLRSRTDEIPSLASLYLGSLNAERGSQISGIEPGALQMMIRYDWPGNYTQFKHVLQELANLTRGAYVSSADVAEVLARERRLHRKIPHLPGGAGYEGMTLEEIELGIVQNVLASCDGNQSRAARQLGISRTTLWRMLSRAEEAGRRGSR